MFLSVCLVDYNYPYYFPGPAPDPRCNESRKLEGMARFALGFAWCEGTALHGLLVLAPL